VDPSSGVDPFDGAVVVAVHRSDGHTMSKPTRPAIRLLAGLAGGPNDA